MIINAFVQIIKIIYKNVIYFYNNILINLIIYFLFILYLFIYLILIKYTFSYITYKIFLLY